MKMFVEIKHNSDGSLPFVLTSVGTFHPQPAVEREAGFYSHQFLWVREGCGHFCFGEDRFDLCAGEGVFMRRGVPHSYEGEHFSTAWCTFDMDAEVLDGLGVGAYLRFRVPIGADRDLEQLHCFASGESTRLSRSSAGYSFVIELFESILSGNESFSSRVRRFLEIRYAEPLSLDEIAGAVDCDRFTLCRKFKTESGITVMEELGRIRIAKAKRLLKYGVDSVEDVGRMCGFDSASYFGKRFREAVGCTPAIYRKKSMRISNT